MDQSELDAALETAASRPQKMSNDEGTVEMPSIQDLIALDNHEANKRAARASAFPLRGTKAKFGGTTGCT